jgi:hypothetical protein
MKKMVFLFFKNKIKNNIYYERMNKSLCTVVVRTILGGLGLLYVTGRLA